MPFWTRPHLDAWDETAVAAGLEKVTLPDFDEPVRLHFHDLRGTTVTLLSESYSTPQQIAPITGRHGIT
jgi:hypothetical protein